MKSKICMRNKFFSVGMLVFLMLFIIACGSSDDTPPVTYNISGAVSGATLAGVTINLTGAAIASATTDASGNFSFTGRANGTYTVTPVKAGYTFNPASSVVVVSGANVTNTNFVATPGVSYSISGTVAGAVQAGVTITLSGSTTGTAVTNASGIYSFSGLVNGNYTVTPSLTGYTFTPANLSITVSGANSIGNNFTSVAVPPPATYSISGAVSGATLAGVTINLTGAATTSTTTDAGGNFSITGLANGAYTVTPVKTGYTFTPSSSAVTMSDANVTGKNFVAATGASTYIISGTVSGAVLSGVKITLSGAGSTTTTNASGNYSFSGIVNGSYTVTPSMTGFTFSPANSAANVSGANVTVPNFVATAIPGTYTQADLTGTWRMNLLKTGPDTEWDRARITINSSGDATCLSVDASFSGGNVCPNPFDLKLTMNTSTGVITQSGNHAVGYGGHMTMTSNKNFVVGTGTNGTTPNFSYQLAIAQKEVSGTSYSNADLQSKSFVYHQLSVGGSNGWNYGAGTTDATRAITLTSQTDPSGTYTGPDTPGGTMSVDGNGVVTMSAGGGMDNFQGFLSDDKKTIVGTVTETGKTNYKLMIIQTTGQTYTAGALPAGTSAAHMLACGASPAPFLLHFTSTVASGGVITLSDWVSSNSGITNPGTTNHGSISASGTVTITEKPTYHGQVSDDGKFTVATQTNAAGVYSLQVNTK